MHIPHRVLTQQGLRDLRRWRSIAPASSRALGALLAPVLTQTVGFPFSVGRSRADSADAQHTEWLCYSCADPAGRRSADIARYARRLWNAMIRDTTATFTSPEKTDARADAYRMLVNVRPGRFPGGTRITVPIARASYHVGRRFAHGAGYVHTAEHSIITGTRGRGMSAGR